MTSILIAGKPVVIGDSLYHTGYQAWGRVTGFDMNTAILQIAGRKVYVANGGIAAGMQQVQWHEPLRLNLPVRDITKYQRMLDALVEFGANP